MLQAAILEANRDLQYSEYAAVGLAYTCSHSGFIALAGRLLFPVVSKTSKLCLIRISVRKSHCHLLLSLAKGLQAVQTGFHYALICSPASEEGSPALHKRKCASLLVGLSGIGSDNVALEAISSRF